MTVHIEENTANAITIPEFSRLQVYLTPSV